MAIRWRAQLPLLARPRLLTAETPSRPGNRTFEDAGAASTYKTGV